LKISVLAAGSWGTALALVLNENGHDVTVWARNQKQVNAINETHQNKPYLKDIDIPKSIGFTSVLKDAVDQSEIIFFALPSQQIRHLLESNPMADWILDHAVIVNVSKGIDMKTLETPSQIFKTYLPQNVFVVLSGPSHAEEVALRMPTALVAASHSRKKAELIQDVISNAYMRVYSHPDVIGVEISGALKNIIAISAGISDGLGNGDNAKAALIARGINEIAELGDKMGADQSTFRGLAGVGDLVVTCTSMHSRNRRCGILIGQGTSFEAAIEQIGMVVEGAYTVKSAYELKQKFDLQMPITTELFNILYLGKDPKIAVNNLMMRQRKHETDEYTSGLDNWL